MANHEPPPLQRKRVPLQIGRLSIYFSKESVGTPTDSGEKTPPFRPISLFFTKFHYFSLFFTILGSEFGVTKNCQNSFKTTENTENTERAATPQDSQKDLTLQTLGDALLRSPGGQLLDVGCWMLVEKS